MEGDIFQIIVPLGASFSYDFGSDLFKRDSKLPATVKEVPISVDKVLMSADNKYNKQQKMVLQYVEKRGKITTKEAENLLLVKERRARSILAELVKSGVLLRQRSHRSIFYVRGQ